MPLVSSSTTLSLRASIAGRSSPTSPSLTPCAASAVALAAAYFSADCSTAAAGGEAGAAEAPALLDAGDGQAGLGGADRRAVAARSAADDHEVVAVVGHVAAPPRR